MALAPRTTHFDLSPQTFDQALTFAQYLAESDLVPKDFKGKPGNCLIAVQWGSELGLKPLQAMQNLAIINGRPSLWGDAVIALVRASPLCEFVIETDDGHAATCRVKRRGETEQSRTFSMADAQAAGLAGKDIWAKYPKRMRQMRARAFALRDVFPDVLRGLPVAEELMDMPPEKPAEKFMGSADVIGAPPPPPPSPPELEPWPDDKLNLREQKIREWGAAGKTVDEIVAFLGSKGTISQEQKARISKWMAEAAAPVIMTYAQVADALTKAADSDALEAAADLINTIADQGQRDELSAIFDRRMGELA
jgi:hypothetical protein